MVFENTKSNSISMLAIILIILFIAITILIIGFFEIRIPFISIPEDAYRKYKSINKVNKHTRKIQHKKIWHNQMHKGFIEFSS